MKRTFKFITALLLSSSIICTIIPHEIIHAQTITISKEIVSDNLYCITEICETPNSEINLFSSSQTKSGSKTQRYVNGNGTTLWYVTVHATFTYNGSSSSCTNASVTAESNSSAWKVTNKSSWKSGNTGYASATATHTLSGSEITSSNRTVSISCSKTGTLQ
jgi:hypothetical protein